MVKRYERKITFDIFDHKIRWIKWKSETGVLCDYKIPIKLWKRFYKTILLLTIHYGSKC